MDASTQPPASKGDGDKIFLVILLCLSVLIVVLLLLIGFGVLQGGISGGRITGGGAAGCGDDNPCTTDSVGSNGACVHQPYDGPNQACSGPAGLCHVRLCSAGSCVSEKILNCCGNGDCEAGETKSTCPIDCGGGEVTTNTEGGDTYNEFNVTEACEPNSGVSDGAICDCTENDCTDGVDNDNDGLIDAQDPDCNCQPSSNCEDQKYPACTGKCPRESQKCVAENGKCTCESQYTCEQTESAYCQRGTCPPNKECKYSNGKCDCQPKYTCDLTQGTSTSTCKMGTCPPGEYCDYRENGCTCLPSQLTCADSYQYQCTGVCDKGTECTRTGWGTCECLQIKCENADVSQCEVGKCPENQECKYVTQEGCSCEPIECGDLDGGSEKACQGGVCDEGQCLPDGNDCSCQVKCEDVTDTRDCVDGYCPDDEVCTIGYQDQFDAITGAIVAQTNCKCAPKCGDIEVSPNDPYGSACYGGGCETGYCTYNYNTQECYCSIYLD